MLGLSKLALRLPALCGGIAFAFFAIRWSARAFPTIRTRVLAVALLTLNPFVLDFLVAARGYSLALAFLMWHLEEIWRGRPVRAATAAGLAVASNLTFLFPTAATTLAAFLLGE